MAEQQNNFTTKVYELKKYMLFAVAKEGDPIENVPKLQPSAIGPSKVGFTAFIPPSGDKGWTAINFSFLTVAIEAELDEILSTFKSTTATEFTIGASRPPVKDNPNRPTKGQLTVGKTDSGICWVEIQAEGKGSQKFNFFPMPGHLSLREGKEVTSNMSPKMAIGWFTGLLRAVRDLSNLSAVDGVKEFGGNNASISSGAKPIGNNPADIPY